MVTEQKDDNKKIRYDDSKILLLDIETSTIDCNDGSKIQEVYLANIMEIDTLSMSIADSKFFRTMNEVVSYLNLITNENIRYICYCHNLDYELFHILRETLSDGVKRDTTDIYNMEQGESIFRDKNAPISVVLEDIPYINFRCSYALFNKTVAQLGKELNLPKLEYDYKVVRTPYDELTELDYEYNKRDNEIVALSLIKRWKERGEKPLDTPLTFTASTKKDRHKFIRSNFGNKALRTLNFDKNSCYNDYDFYTMTVEAYQGGLTTANKKYFNKAIENKIMSIDITSSYPYQMCSRRYPIYLESTTSHFENEEAMKVFEEFLYGVDHTKLKEYSGFCGYFALVDFYNIEIADDRYLLPLSRSKCFNIENEEVVNGKIVKADKLSIYLDNVTLDWINRTYNYDDIYVYDLYTTTKDRYLQLSELSFILDGFNTKQKLKAKEQRGEEFSEEEKLAYALAKVNINAMYGVKVQKPLKDRYDIINGEVIKIEYKDDYKYDISQKEVYNNFLEIQHENIYKNNEGKNFDIFTDGVYVTAYARYMLIDMMIKLTDIGCICVYCDTDSLKFIIPENEKSTSSHNVHFSNNRLLNNYTITKVTQFIEKVNMDTINGNKNNYRFTEFKRKFKLSDEDFNRILPLGTWDIENKRDKNNNVLLYPYFKTLGAKKYAYISAKYDKESNTIKEEVKTTIAGCSKKVAATITKYCTIKDISLIEGLDEVFNVGTMFDESCSGRTVSKREDREPFKINTLKYKCNNKNVVGNGGMIIEDTSYTLNLSQSDENVLELYRVEDVIRILNSEGELNYI